MTREQAGDDDDLVQHIIENQVEPQLTARRLRERGVDIDVAFVSTSPEAEGFLVECYGCGRQARLPFDPGAKVLLCPSCQRALE